jgi:oligopeptidase B
VQTLRFKDLATGRIWPDALPGVMDQIAWANDNRTLFYIRQDPVTLNNGPVFRHRLGQPAARDGQAFAEADKTHFVTLARTASGRQVRVAVDDYDSSETWALDADQPSVPAVRVLARRAGVRHEADHLHGRWYIRTNEAARNFRLVSVPERWPDERRHWRTVVPARATITLERFVLLRRGIAVQERQQADSRVRWLGRAPAGAAAVALPTADAGTQITLAEHPDAAAAHLRYTVQSMVQPAATWDWHLASGRRQLRHQRPVPGYDAGRYATERLFLPARDGQSIPVTLAWRPDRARRDGQAPLWLLGYGAYGLSMDPDFSANRLSLMDRGFVVGIAHVRGGAEMGEDWYEMGRGLHKPNSFNDYVDATQALVRLGWADPRRVFAVGGSAGGLLMGVVANQAPQLYRGMVLDVPFVDVLSTMLDGSIPLTTQEWSQWGDPRQQPVYETMLAYSPYDNIRAMAYPAMLVTTGLWDGNVPYHEPVKYVARLRARKTDQQPLLLHVNLNAGHGGAAGRFEALDANWRWSSRLSSAWPACRTPRLNRVPRPPAAPAPARSPPSRSSCSSCSASRRRSCACPPRSWVRARRFAARSAPAALRAHGLRRPARRRVPQLRGCEAGHDVGRQQRGAGRSVHRHPHFVVGGQVALPAGLRQESGPRCPPRRPRCAAGRCGRRHQSPAQTDSRCWA